MNEIFRNVRTRKLKKSYLQGTRKPPVRLVRRYGGAIERKADNYMSDNQTREKAAPEFAGAYSEIPKKLKAYYDSLQEEVIPDRFLDLLEKLDRAEQAAKQADAVRELE